MLSKIFFAKELDKIILNFGLSSKDEKKDDYMKFMFEELTFEEITDKDFASSVRQIIDKEKKLYAFPSKKMIIEHCTWEGITPRLKRITGQVLKKTIEQKDTIPSVSIEKMKSTLKSITNNHGN